MSGLLFNIVGGHIILRRIPQMGVTQPVLMNQIIDDALLLVESSHYN